MIMRNNNHLHYNANIFQKKFWQISAKRAYWIFIELKIRQIKK